MGMASRVNCLLLTHRPEYLLLMLSERTEALPLRSKLLLMSRCKQPALLLLIFGPPGTGKARTVVEGLLRAVRVEERR